MTHPARDRGRPHPVRPRRGMGRLPGLRGNDQGQPLRRQGLHEVHRPSRATGSPGHPRGYHGATSFFNDVIAAISTGDISQKPLPREGYRPRRKQGLARSIHQSPRDTPTDEVIFMAPSEIYRIYEKDMRQRGNIPDAHSRSDIQREISQGTLLGRVNQHHLRVHRIQHRRQAVHLLGQSSWKNSPSDRFSWMRSRPIRPAVEISFPRLRNYVPH